jgi:Tyrosine phosphatase family
MIARFREVVPGKLYRGGSPSPSDVKMLRQKYGIKKIVSLDLAAAVRINLVCALMGIEHLIFPIDIEKRITLIPFLNNIEEIFKLDVPTFVHCKFGKDRSGLAIAIYRCQYQKWPAKKAINEARSLGFGVGIPPKITKLFLKVIKEHCDNQEDSNHAEDIVEGAHIGGSYDDYYGDAISNLSWGPYGDYRVREFPFSPVEINPRAGDEDFYSVRQNYGLNEDEYIPREYDQIPTVGLYDTVESTNGMGFSNVNNGFI